MDALKQGSSAAMIHVMNIVLAISLVVSSDTPSDQDQVGADWSKKERKLISQSSLAGLDSGVVSFCSVRFTL